MYIFNDLIGKLNTATKLFVVSFLHEYVCTEFFVTVKGLRTERDMAYQYGKQQER
jgi:hypothetical protein